MVLSSTPYATLLARSFSIYPSFFLSIFYLPFLLSIHLPPSPHSFLVGSSASRTPAAPASTAREIAGLGALPQAARSAFGVIATLVERSRYALRPLGQPDWAAARAAYAGFAVPARGAA